MTLRTAIDSTAARSLFQAMDSELRLQLADKGIVG